MSMQMRQECIPDEEAAEALRAELSLVSEAIRHADCLIDAKEAALAMLDGTDRSLGAIDRAMMEQGYR